MDYEVIVLAAGKGKRMKAGMNKLWIPLQGKPILHHTLEVFERDDWCQRIILVHHPEEKDLISAQIHNYKTPISLISGGGERQDSVRAGLGKALLKNLILIHDGARPFVTHDKIHLLVKKAEEVGAALLATQVTDTIKSTKEKQLHTLDRSYLWAAQTPQAFHYSLIEKVHQRAVEAGFLGTDDASLAEKYGYKVAIVEGEKSNIKLTSPDDLEMAEWILNKREKMGRSNI
ncbi:2-C-methyl-D-erythritol 4-phosphate cytidylyltransferase [Bacillaceae bacterium S4-13-56]